MAKVDLSPDLGRADCKNALKRKIWLHGHDKGESESEDKRENRGGNLDNNMAMGSVPSAVTLSQTTCEMLRLQNFPELSKTWKRQRGLTYKAERGRGKKLRPGEQTNRAECWAGMGSEQEQASGRKGLQQSGGPGA